MTNCEKYKTAQERAEEFHRFCEINVYGDCCKCGAFGNGKGGLTSCVLSWLDLEAEEEKPLPCPFCGGVCFTATVITRTGSSSEYVSCNDCSYCYGNKPIGEAIAAHNRVAKKCMEGNHGS